MPKAVSIKQNPENEIPAEVIAESIVTIAQGVKKMSSGRLQKRALIVLIQDACGGPRKISLETILTVLNGMEDLEAKFVNRRRT